jgi:hypothetical protein
VNLRQWTVDEMMTLLVTGSEYPEDVYVVEVDTLGITYEMDGYRFFVPWTSVLNLHRKV